MKTNFPNLGAYQLEEVNTQLLAQIFPWGCGKLATTRNLETQQFFFRQYPGTRENIFQAIKYGIWSFPDKQYLSRYKDFEDLKHSDKRRTVYWGFTHKEGDKNWLYGIAEVLDYEPKETFKYWQNENRQLCIMQGVVRLAFIAVGKIDLDTVKEASLPHKYRDLRATELPLMEMLESDKQEDRIRESLKDGMETSKSLEQFNRNINGFFARMTGRPFRTM